MKIIDFIPETWRHGNGYVIHTEQGDIYIDPAYPIEKKLDEGDIALLLATHAHFDHIAEVDNWRDEYGAPFALCEADVPMLPDEEANASKLFCMPRKFNDPDRIIKDGDKLDFGDVTLDVIQTPGHTTGSCCFIVRQNDEPVAFISGDTVFADSVGRSDLPFGDSKQMAESIGMLKALFTELPDIPLLPGHGGASTTKTVMERNPYFSDQMINRFI